MIEIIVALKGSSMITFSVPEGRGLQHSARGKSVTAEDIHDVLRREPARFLIVPWEFSDNENYRLDVMRLKDPATQSSSPPEIYRNGDYTDVFYTADALVAEATAFVWGKIAQCLRESADIEDRRVGDAIAEQLGTLIEIDPELVQKVELGSPMDWMKRVYSAQRRVSFAHDD